MQTAAISRSLSEISAISHKNCSLNALSNILYIRSRDFFWQESFLHNKQFNRTLQIDINMLGLRESVSDMHTLYRIRKTFVNNPTDLNIANHINRCYSVLVKAVEQQRCQLCLFHHKYCDIWYLIRFPAPENRISVLLPAFLAGKKNEKVKWHFENKSQKQLHFLSKVSKPNYFWDLDFSVLKYSD